MRRAWILAVRLLPSRIRPHGEPLPTPRAGRKVPLCLSTAPC
jgi:hypothetical protein